jgi:hypothetical protein
MRKLTFQGLVRELARREGKKEGINIANLSEATARLLEILAELPLLLVAFLIAEAAARKRARKGRR